MRLSTGAAVLSGKAKLEAAFRAQQAQEEQAEDAGTVRVHASKNIQHNLVW
jgi:hypothetical protein